MFAAAQLPMVLAGIAAVAAAQEPAAIDFIRDVAPILREHCVRCHGPKKQKGDLRLDRRADLFAGQADTWSVRPGDPDGSELLRRVTLPAGDDDLMPAEGEPLPAVRVATLRRWIAEGAHWPEDGDDAFGALPPAPIMVPVLDPVVRGQVDAAIAALRQRGAVAQRIAEGSDAIEVNLRLLRAPAADRDLELLRPLAPVLVWLDLSRSQVTDAGMAVVGSLGQLRRVHLAETAVGDAGLEHLGALRRLELLNLQGSRVTDAGLAAVAAMPALRKLFVWRTAVTAAGAQAVGRDHPDLNVDRGDYAEARLAAAATLAAAKAAPARPANARCPVTGRLVDPAVTLEHGGRTLGFCCGDCRTRFAADPAAFPDPGKR